MAQQTHHLVPFFIFILSFVSCYTTLQEEHSYVTRFDSRGYPLLFEDLMIKKRTDHVSSLTRFDGADDETEVTVNVQDFGANADGTDDTEAFKKAWEEACEVACSSKGVVLVAPQNNYLLKPIRFSGPCKSDLTMKISGSIEASDDRSDYSEDGEYWIMFESVQNLLVEGGGSGTINGNGKIWWQNSCKLDKAQPCKNAPTALTFYKCKNLIVKNLKIQDAQQIHVSFNECKNVQAFSLTVSAPQKSPNTDGIHVTDTQNIQIQSCIIETGDDCISIVSGSENVKATNITCGPGHGISIGSLGQGTSEAYVSGVTVDGAKLYGTTNGVRIKTWQGGSGSARNIKFQNIEMHSVTNPIMIDQYYCDQEKSCEEQSSAVQVKNVLYQNIQGTSASDVAIKFDCSKSFPCKEIVLQNINLEHESEGETTKALCKNVELTDIGIVSPRCHDIDNIYCNGIRQGIVAHLTLPETDCFRDFEVLGSS